MGVFGDLAQARIFSGFGLLKDISATRVVMLSTEELLAHVSGQLEMEYSGNKFFMGNQFSVLPVILSCWGQRPRLLANCVLMWYCVLFFVFSLSSMKNHCSKKLIRNDKNVHLSRNLFFLFFFPVALTVFPFFITGCCKIWRRSSCFQHHE